MINNNNLQNLKHILSKNFPIRNIKAIYGYGSGIFPQKDNTPKMIDLIFIVDNSQNFHKENLIRNKNHYSKLARLSIFFLNYVNNHGTKIYYNPNVLLENNINIKYGIISHKDFIENLNNWDNLFIAGRFHKPVKEIFPGEIIEKINSENFEGKIYSLFKIEKFHRLCIVTEN